MSDNSSISTPDSWLPLPPKGGKGGKNETSLDYQAFKVYANLTPSERSIPRTCQILGRNRGPYLISGFSQAESGGGVDSLNL